MQIFRCDVCGRAVFFDNTVCLGCGADLVFDPAVWGLRARAVGDVLCANRPHGCTWLVAGDGGSLCESCQLTRTIPPQQDPGAVAAWQQAEAAKRRLLFQTGRMGLDLSRVRFDLLSSRERPVTTGHDDGLITLDLAEADDVVLARMREEMDEPYRTLLGHFRHEIGHYLWQRYVADSPHLASFRELFGDEREDYQQALQRHYSGPPPAGWEQTHVSRYATTHPWEDVAETIAHHLHITDVLDSASATGLQLDGRDAGLRAGPDAIADDASFDAVLEHWLPLATALNEINRSLGEGDLYPFVLPPTVVRKLTWVHDLFRDVAGPARGVS